MRRRKTEQIANIGQDIIAKIDPGGRRHESQAVRVWPQVAGADISKHTMGFAMREGELVVFVDSPAWATELTLMAETLRKKINSHIGQNLVTSMRFTVSKKVKQEQRQHEEQEREEGFYLPDEGPSIPLSDTELAQAKHMAQAVNDDELRETALRVMIKDLERKKGARAFNASQAATEGSKDTDSTS